MHLLENIYALYVFWTNYGLFWPNFDLKCNKEPKYGQHLCKQNLYTVILPKYMVITKKYLRVLYSRIYEPFVEYTPVFGSFLSQIG